MSSHRDNSNVKHYDGFVNSSGASSSIAKNSQFRETGVEYQMTLLGSKVHDDGERGKSEHAPIIAGCALEAPPKQGSLWNPKPGQLTILDLSCPCISPGTACSLFNIALAIFMEQESDIGRVVALDEAHKYMKTSSEAQAFTETLLSVVRLQRHLAARVIISTQEPTVSTDLLNLCTATIVHRFTSPEWLRILQKHLAGAATNPFARKAGKAPARATDGEEGQLNESNERSLFGHIVNLRVGEALLFSPSSIVDVEIEDGGHELRRLGSDYLAIKIRQRLTTDGGRSVIAA
ncbi:hypothetical protein CBS147343_8193 [Aspergillus niger]|nr:hypothetical protein CBS147343_8193 [Aspergillus niger]